MKKIILSLVLGAFFVITNAQNNPNKVNAVSAEVPQEDVVNAVIEFESKVVDYGVIEHNSDGKREFIFTNTGSDPLKIKNAKGSCGCTVPSWRKEDGSSTWAPGEKGVIGVKYATNRIGKFTKTITLTTNASKKPVILTIKGEVNPAPKEETVPEKKTEGSPLEKN